jgi:hypothetical protein
MAFDIIAIFEDQTKLAQLTGELLGGNVSNGTGIFAAAPATLATGLNTITVTTPGTFVVTLPSGTSAVIAAGTGTITGGGAAAGGTTTTITFTGIAGQTFTVTTTVNATSSIIEVVGLRTIQAVVGASLNGGYKLDPAAVTIAGNKVTIQPQYYHYGSGIIADGVAINVPTSVDLSAILYNLTVLGY